MKAIYERELRSYFSGITGYFFVAFFLLIVGIYAAVINLKNAYSGFEYVLKSLGFVYLILIPILSMRVISEERRQKTDQLLYALPVGMTKVVLAKYFAMLTVLAVPTLVMCFYPVFLTMYGTVWLPSAYCAIAGFFLLGAALLAVGTFVSSLTDNQAAAAVLCFAVLLINFLLSSLSSFMSGSPKLAFFAITAVIAVAAVIVWLMTKNAFFGAAIGAVLEIGATVFFLASSASLTGLVPKVLSKLSVFDQFGNFVSGIFDLTAVAYFAAVSAVMLFLAVQSLEKRRWN